MITPPDETYSPAEAGAVLGRSERQVLRYLSDGRLEGSRISGRWRVTAVALWRFQGIEAEMLALWCDYCLRAEAARRDEQ